MQITAIEKQKNDPSRVSIYIDGEFVFGMSEEDAYFYKLATGRELNEDEYQSITSGLSVTAAKNAALKYLGYRVRSRKEIITYLKEKKHAESVIESVVKTLESYKYIDDREFARLYIADAFKLNKWGARKIKSELAIKGVPRDIIDECLSSADIDINDILLPIIVKKLGGAACNDTAKPDSKTKRKVFEYLMRRGFSPDEISTALNIYIESLDEKSEGY